MQHREIVGVDADVEDRLRLVEKYRLTTTFSAPTPIRLVYQLPEEVKARYDRPSMKRMIANAAPGVDVALFYEEGNRIEKARVRDEFFVRSKSAFKTDHKAAHAVVKRANEALSAEQLIEWARGHLADYEIPRSISWIDEIPRNASGKRLRDQRGRPSFVISS